jgi:hypothetical protein
MRWGWDAGGNTSIFPVRNWQVRSVPFHHYAVHQSLLTSCQFVSPNTTNNSLYGSRVLTRCMHYWSHFGLDSGVERKHKQDSGIFNWKKIQKKKKKILITHIPFYMGGTMWCVSHSIWECKCVKGVNNIFVTRPYLITVCGLGSS